jgi:sulfatase-like protein
LRCHRYPDTPEVRRDWANDYELITAMDYQAGDRLRELEQAGLMDDTIVFFWSDHGIGLPRAKRWLYDSGTRAALVVRVPEKYRATGQARPGSADDQLVSFIDLAPTVLNLAGVSIPEHMQGRAFLGPRLTAPREYIYGARDRMDERYDIIRAIRDKRYRYIRNYESHKPYYQHMNTPEQGPTMREIRRVHAEGKLPDAARQFMADHKPPEELYDLQTDPHEVRNLVKSTAHRSVLDRMRQAHRRWMIDTRDTGLLPEPELVEREKMFGTRHAILRQPDGDDLMKRLLAVMDSSNPASMLRDKHPAVRYWAAIRVHDDSVRPLLQDSSPSVRVAAAAGLGAIDVLEKELQNPEETVRLLAANALDGLGERARPALKSLKTALNDGNRYVARTVNHAVNTLTGATNEVP